MKRLRGGGFSELGGCSVSSGKSTSKEHKQDHGETLGEKRLVGKVTEVRREGARMCRERGHGPNSDVQPGRHVPLRGPEATRMPGVHVHPHLTGQRECGSPRRPLSRSHPGQKPAASKV